MNLALVVGERRPDGLHELASVMQRIADADDVDVAEAPELGVEGYPEDTLVRSALERLATAAGVEPRWRVRVRKRIPVAAGLGGGSADAAAALVAANEKLAQPIDAGRLADVAFSVGSDVPFFLEPGPKLVEGAGERLRAVELPQDYWLLVGLPHGVEKRATADVYARFDDLGRAAGFATRRERLLRALVRCERVEDLATLPPNDLAQASGAGDLADEIAALGAIRADVSGAGPAAYGIFATREGAERARSALRSGDAWVSKPVW